MAASRFTTFLDTFDPDSNRRGTQWEHVCKWFLETDPVYCAQLKKVWLWDQWRGRWGPDAGIDLVAEAKDGTLWAIQAKAYASDNAVTKRDVDSFLSESARAEFRHRLLIATTSSVSQAATWAVAEWTAAILEDEHVQARLLGDARQGRLHHAVLGQLLLRLRAPRSEHRRGAPTAGQAAPWNTLNTVYSAASLRNARSPTRAARSGRRGPGRARWFVQPDAPLPPRRPPAARPRVRHRSSRCLPRSGQSRRARRWPP